MLKNQITEYEENFNESLASLENYRNYIEVSLECHQVSTESILSNTISGITSSFGNMVNKLNFFISSPVKEIEEIRTNLTRKEKKFVDAVNKHNYPEMTPLGTYVPEGMITTYVEYLEALESAAIYAAGVEERFNTFYTYLALLISTPDGRKINQDNSIQYKRMEKERETVIKNLSSCFGKKFEVDSVYEKTIRRNGDWELIFSKLHRIDDVVKKVSQKTLQEKITQIVEMLKIVQKMVEEKTLVNATAGFLKELGEGTHQLAREAEWFSVVYFRTLGINAAVDRTVDNLNRIYL